MVGLFQVEVGMARALRSAFRHHHDFRWDPDPAISKVAIYDEWPLVGRRYPSISIAAQAPNLLKGYRGIGEEFAEMETTAIAINGISRIVDSVEVLSGNNRIFATLSCEARTRPAALQLADWCALFMRSFASSQFTKEGLVVEDISSTPVQGRLEGADPVFSVSLQVTCLTAFTRQIPLSLAQTIDAICLTGVFTSLPDGSTYGETYL